LLPAGRQVIQSYGTGQFVISDVRHSGPMLVFPERCLAWDVGAFDALTPADFTEIIDAEPKSEILLLGCGERGAFLPAAMASEIRNAGIIIETMNTGAACRTFNVLIGEDRRVAAALFTVD